MPLVPFTLFYDSESQPLVQIHIKSDLFPKVQYLDLSLSILSINEMSGSGFDFLKNFLKTKSSTPSVCQLRDVMRKQNQSSAKDSTVHVPMLRAIPHVTKIQILLSRIGPHKRK